MQTIDYKAAREHVLANYPNDPLLRHIMLTALEQLPKADAAPVVHAHWDKWYPPKHMILTGEEMLYRCSSCTAKYADVSGYNYCPFCGAKMDVGSALPFQEEG